MLDTKSKDSIGLLTPFLYSSCYFQYGIIYKHIDRKQISFIELRFQHLIYVVDV